MTLTKQEAKRLIRRAFWQDRRDVLEQVKLGLKTLGRPRQTSPDAVIQCYHGYGDILTTSLGFIKDAAMNSGKEAHLVDYDFGANLREVAQGEAERLLGSYDKNGQKFHLFGHSQGGLLTAAIAQEIEEIHSGESIIERIVNVCVPYRGTDLACAFSPNTARYLQPGSRELSGLVQRGFPGVDEVISLAVKNDPFLVPSHSGFYLPQNDTEQSAIAFSKQAGHLTLISKEWAPRVVQLLLGGGEILHDFYDQRIFFPVEDSEHYDALCHSTSLH